MSRKRFDNNGMRQVMAPDGGISVPGAALTKVGA